LFAHAEGDTFILLHHTQKLYNQYGGKRNIITFKGDHNSMRPKFFYDSVSIFFYNLLLDEDQKASLNSPKEFISYNDQEDYEYPILLNDEDTDKNEFNSLTKAAQRLQNPSEKLMEINQQQLQHDSRNSISHNNNNNVNNNDKDNNKNSDSILSPLQWRQESQLKQRNKDDDDHDHEEEEEEEEQMLQQAIIESFLHNTKSFNEGFDGTLNQCSLCDTTSSVLCEAPLKNRDIETNTRVDPAEESSNGNTEKSSVLDQ